MSIFRSRHCANLIISALLLISSCGLKYTTPESPESFQQRRQEKVKTYVRNNLGIDSVTFEAVAFGKTNIIRPPSFRMLDSLYRIKYKNEKEGIYDRELDKIIQAERQALQKDTGKIKYIENLIFTYIQTDDSTFGSSTFSKNYVNIDLTLDHELNVQNESVNNTIVIQDSLDETYRRFLFRESFIYPGSYPTEEESMFYDFFNEKIEQSSVAEKDELIIHTLTVMQLAYARKTLNTAKIIYRLAQRELDKKYPFREDEVFTEIFTSSSNRTEEHVNGYSFNVIFKNSVNQREMEVFFRFDDVYRLTVMTEL